MKAGHGEIEEEKQLHVPGLVEAKRGKFMGKIQPRNQSFNPVLPPFKVEFHADEHQPEGERQRPKS